MRALQPTIIHYINMEKENLIDKVTNENNKIVISNKSVKWVLGILVVGIMGIFGFAYGLYVKVDDKVDTNYKELNSNIDDTGDDIMEKLEDLDKEKVEPNSDKNYKQDMDIVRLYERTNSKSDRLNSNTNRPQILDSTVTLPNIGI